MRKVRKAARVLAVVVMALAAGSSIWLAVPPLARVITGDDGSTVIPLDARPWLWYPTAGSQALSDVEILTLWVAALGAALLAALTTIRLTGGRR